MSPLGRWRGMRSWGRRMTKRSRGWRGGRGRRSWCGPDGRRRAGPGDEPLVVDRGALTFSVAIDPAADSLAAPRWPCLALATAVGICGRLTAGCRHLEVVSKTNCRTDPREPLPRFSRLQPGFETASPEEGGACVKWPNDVWWGDRKLAGVLVEVSRGGESVGQTGQGGWSVWWWESG